MARFQKTLLDREFQSCWDPLSVKTYFWSSNPSQSFTLAKREKRELDIGTDSGCFHFIKQKGAE